MAADLHADFGSWFEIIMRDELAICHEEKHAEKCRDYVLRTWLLYAPVAGTC